METKKESRNFIELIIDEDLSNGKNDGRVHTRFPPEPNGYMHIGHVKSVYVNFGTAQKYGGKTNLRFDDTNPIAEDVEYVDSIKKDIEWLGYKWDDDVLFASNYFDQLYDYAIALIKKGKAYVDDSSAEEIAAMKGTPTEPGTDSPYRNRSVAENLDLLERMKNGEFDEGSKVIRAKIDMSNANMHLRDPLMYRIRKVKHHQTGDAWSIYPMYDWAHGLSDSIEGITHSICTLEFEVHRPLYEWFLNELEVFCPQQIEMARLNLSYTIMSKRRLKKLVEEQHVNGWDDPRMPTVSGMRRRGYPAESLRNFAQRVGVARRNHVIDVSLLEFSVRETLNKTAPRVMGVLDPVKLVITNYPEGEVEHLTMINNPEDETQGSRQVPFSRELYIEREDFMEDAPKKFFRLAPGKNVRLKGAYIINCHDVVKNASGVVTEIHCTYYPDSKSGSDTSGVKAKGTLHFVSIPHAVDAEVRLYDRLFSDESPMGHKDRDYLEFLNPNSLTVITAKVEPHLKDVKPLDSFQFMRKGYFAVDDDSTPEHLVFNRTVTLRDGWKKK